MKDVSQTLKGDLSICVDDHNKSNFHVAIFEGYLPVFTPVTDAKLWVIDSFVSHRNLVSSFKIHFKFYSLLSSEYSVLYLV